MSTPILPKRYRLEKELGRGAVGQVYQAWDNELECSVAIKITQPRLAQQKRFRRLFSREIRLAARLVHPRIVPLHDAGFTQDRSPFLSMALADAGSFGRFRNAPPPWPELLRMTLELLEALAFVHAQGVVHRDLKPENVLLYKGEDGRLHAWLADLGAANLAEDMPKEEEIGGTPMYIAPEHATGDVGLISKATDLYAVVAVLKELMTGKPPFPGKSFEELVQIKEQPPALWAPRKGYAIPDGLVDLLNRQLDPNSLDRYDLAADLAHALISLCGHPDQGPVDPRMPSLNPRGTALKLDTRVRLTEGILPYGAGAPSPQRPDNGVPRWLRQLPPPLPEEVPAEPITGRSGQASAMLFAYRRHRLVGRQELRQRLWDEAREVVSSGNPRVVLLVGDAGVGKSRLAQSLASQLEQGGWMEALELRHQNPPGPTDGLLGALVRDLRPEAGSRKPVSERALEKLARWRGQCSDKERRDARLLARRARPPKEGDEARRAADVRWYLFEHLEAHAWRGGVMLLIEDAQWADDEGGLAYAEALVRSQGTLAIPALVVATIRAEALAEDPSLKMRCMALLDQGATWLEVPRMTPQEVEGVLQEYLTLDPAFAREMARRCDGNPLFAHQLLDAWLQSKTLINLGGLRYGLAPGVDIDHALPASTEALLLERVEGWIRHSPRPDALRQALHLAAMAGAEVPISLLDVVLGPVWSRELLAASTVGQQEQELFRFNHGLLREALLRQAEARPDAAALHLSLVQGWLTIEARSGEPTGLRVADHLLKGGRPAEALSRCLVAADAAERAGQVGRMRQAAEMGLAGAEAAGLATGDRRGVAARRFIALAHEARGELGAAHGIHKTLLEESQSNHMTRLEEMHRRDLAQVLRKEGRLDAAEGLYDQAVQLARQRGDAGAEAACLRGLAEIHRMRGDTRRSMELLGDALSLSRKARDKEGIARALKDRARTAIAPGKDLRTEEAWIREAASLAEQLELDRLEAECQQIWAELVKARGDLSTARMRYAHCARVFAERDLAEAASVALLNLALIELTLGRADAAQVFVADARRWLAASPDHWLQPVASLYEAVASAQAGDLILAEAHFEQARRQGLGGTALHDLAAPLDQLATIAARSRAKELSRAAGELAADTWRKLGEGEEAERLKRKLARLEARA